MADAPIPSSDNENADKNAYRVLALKYRPNSFNELVGQQAMVQTLSNAITQGRLAHAFILTGVRGTGKTSTARIISRALNCIGPDGTGGPTIEPCGVCEHCKAITEDRHMDVIEMDAASRTGVDDIRDILDGVRYRPTSARYKVYIIDEIHMLSKNAFNALLKTLEEPPEHVKFIFATTEIRKVPVTVLSRCQRFDLRRIDTAELAEHFGKLVELEGASIDETALHMIARAADGSVRDGLSLLDQAIAHCAGKVGEQEVRAMLGLADRERTFDIMDAVMKGNAPEALAVLDDLYNAGADPSIVLEDLLELSHWLTRLKIVPKAAEAAGVPEAERVRGSAMANNLAMPVLTRTWQILLKGLGEVRFAPSPLQAAEMVLIRLAYAAELPTPEEAVKALADAPAPRDAGGAPPPGPRSPGADLSSPSAGPQPTTQSPSPADTPAPQPAPAPVSVPVSGPPAPAVEPKVEPEPEPKAEPEPAPEEKADPKDFGDVVDLVGAHREMIMQANLVSAVHLVHFEPGRIVFRTEPNAPRDLSANLAKFLNAHTVRRWVVATSQDGGEATLTEQANAVIAAEKAKAAEHPLVQAVLATFPDAEIERVVHLENGITEAPIEPDDSDDALED